ncbi:MAG: prepilin peptidase [Hadesarchaea archaeon]|nr:prepilin peptidase [Hadesarchaea archaeon]
MMESHAIPAVLALAAVLIATYTDLRERIIPNWLTVSFTAAGIAFHGFLGAFQGDLFVAVSGALGASISFAIGYVLWRAGGWAGGDVKLFTALGSLLFNYKMPAGNPIYPVPLTILFNGIVAAAPFLFIYVLILRSRRQGVLFARVRVGDLKEGMIPAEAVFERNGTVYRSSVLPNTGHRIKIYANPKRMEGLTVYQIRALKRLFRERKIDGTIRIKRCLPFAPVLAAGTLITVLYGDLYWLFLTGVLA